MTKELDRFIVIESLKDRRLMRLREVYSDFGPTFTSEKLKSEGININKETLRQWIHEANLSPPNTM